MVATSPQLGSQIRQNVLTSFGSDASGVRSIMSAPCEVVGTVFSVRSVESESTLIRRVYRYGGSVAGSITTPVGAPGSPPALPSGVRAWLIGARVRTLPAAVVPVLVGTAVAVAQRPNGSSWSPVRALLALLVSLALQIGVNFANDYSDGVRGTDDARVGPLRLVGSGVKTAGAVKGAAFAALGTAALAGLVLAALTSWWLIAVGLCAIVAAWGYTGGPRPYGYAGLGEVFVFVFFGVVAVAGSAFVQHERLTVAAFVAAFPVGLLATALLVTNNLRDIPGDQVAGKRTLAVRLGDRRTRTFFVCLVGGAFAAIIVLAIVLGQPWVVLGLLAAPLALGPLGTLRRGALGRDLIPVLGGTAKLQLAVGALVSIGIIL